MPLAVSPLAMKPIWSDPEPSRVALPMMELYHAPMENGEAPRHPAGSVRYVVKRVDLARLGVKRRPLRWFPDYQDKQMHALLQRDIAALNEYDKRHPELMAELEAMSAEVMANEPDYDWGPEGPPS